MKQPIIEQFAETLWACAWADWQDELSEDDPEKVNMSGCEITEIMSDVPDSAVKAGRKLFDRLNEMNGGNLAEKMEAVCERDDSDLEYLAHYIAMECLGHGVAYSDDYPDHNLKTLGYLEVITFDGQYLEMF